MQFTEPAIARALTESSPDERRRDEVLKCLESAGRRPVAELSEMSDAERCKWLFWNLHQNLEAVRQMEPALQARINSMQYSVMDETRLADHAALNKRLDLACRWTMELSFPGYPEEVTYPIGDGWVNLVIAAEAPAYLHVASGQKAYLDADHTTYPNQIYLEGWISDQLWQDVRAHLSNPNPSCRTDVVLLDSALFPVRRDFDFVAGPPGAIGVISLEFRAFSHPTERRMVRRSEPRRSR
jgi:hypothetical protein